MDTWITFFDHRSWYFYSSCFGVIPSTPFRTCKLTCCIVFCAVYGLYGMVCWNPYMSANCICSHIIPSPLYDDLGFGGRILMIIFFINKLNPFLMNLIIWKDTPDLRYAADSLNPKAIDLVFRWTSLQLHQAVAFAFLVPTLLTVIAVVQGRLDNMASILGCIAFCLAHLISMRIGIHLYMFWTFVALSGVGLASKIDTLVLTNITRYDQLRKDIRLFNRFSSKLFTIISLVSTSVNGIVLLGVDSTSPTRQPFMFLALSSTAIAATLFHVLFQIPSTLLHSKSSHLRIRVLTFLVGQSRSTISIFHKTKLLRMAKSEASKTPGVSISMTSLDGRSYDQMFILKYTIYSLKLFSLLHKMTSK